MPTAAHPFAICATRAREVTTAALIVCAIGVASPARAGNPVLEWNDVAQRMTVVPALTPVQQTRIMAIVHVAIHDAVNGITRKYEQYKRFRPDTPGLSPEGAAIGAAHRALAGIFGQSDLLASAYASSLLSYAISPDDPALAFGESVAERILALRENDGAALAAYPYVPEDAGVPGVWVPIGSAASAQALLPGWGNVKPFVMRRTSQFRPDAPPALDSEAYAEDYNEILQIGESTSIARTDEQTQIALFWRASPTALWNPILRKAIETRGLGLSAAARAAALFYLAASDASVACWEAKYAYNFWRPQAAINRGDEDGNHATLGNPAWRPLVPTPPHPEYPSGHASNSGAMATVLKSIFGDAPGFTIEATSPQNVGFVRHWQTFTEGVREVIEARIYSGIHFRTADEVGARLGRRVAKFVMAHALRPVRRR
jgi:hypothetical protein